VCAALQCLSGFRRQQVLNVGDGVRVTLMKVQEEAIPSNTYRQTP
jgi:hypothetical protein